MSSTLPPPALRHKHEPGLRDFLLANAARFERTLGFTGFFSDLDSEEQERIERLFQCAVAVGHGVDEDVLTEAEVLVRALPDDDAAGAIVARTFAEALRGRALRLHGSGGNLYLGARPPGAQLRAFELLRLRTPLIPFAYAASNRALLAELAGHEVVTLIDVGIGRGGQMSALLRHPTARRVQRIRVVGIEPDSEELRGTGALERAAIDVLSSASQAGVQVSFHAIARRGEDLTATDFADAGLEGKVIANAAFCLHHISYGQGLDRVGVLRLLRDAGASAIVLAEPDTDHDTADLPLRTLYAYRHYRTVERSLRALLEPGDAALVWQEFFAPEVRNVVGFEGAQRTERHQEATRWLEHLRAAGWTPDDALEDLVPQAAAPPGFAVHNQGDRFSLAYEGVDLLSVMRARADGA